MDCHFFSETLGMNVSMNVILPQRTSGQIGLTGHSGGDKHPVLFLLHGLSDDHTIWLRRTSIERYASELGLAVIMPNVHRSFYANMASGLNYWTFISEELPELVRSFFPISHEREHTFVAGLSMGGYGALKLGLSQPERYAAAAALSAVADVDRFARDYLKSSEAESIFGAVEQIAGSSVDLFRLAERHAASGAPKLKLFQACGTEDFLYQDNIRLRDHIRAQGLELTYMEHPGKHNWAFWDQTIQDVLKWLPLKQQS